MASKEATVYIVDVGATMGEQGHGRTKTNLDWALEYVYDKITTTVATGRKTAMAGVIALRSDDTANELGSEPAYEHLSVLEGIGQIQMPQVRRLRDALKVSRTESGDAISALILAIQMIRNQCKKLQYMRKIVLVTDGRAPMDADGLGSIAEKIKEDKMELVVLGVDFDDEEYGYKEEGKDATKAENEEMLRGLCDDCDGVFGTLLQAVDEMQIPRVKGVRSVATFKGCLTLGNPQEYDTALAIDVEIYPKVMVAKPPSASKYAIRTDMASGEATQSTATMIGGDEGTNGAHDGLAVVRSTRAYQVVDEDAPGGKREVERDELARGYEYGRTAVHIAESDRNVTDYETLEGFDILGFIERQKYERYMDMSTSGVVVAARGNDKASMSLSSFIHALYELETCAVARLVKKDNKPPRLILLVPHVEADFECLYDVELPYTEDLRSYKFPPLDRVVTVSGKTLKIHRNLPSADLVEAMSDYVDSMDLSTFGKSDEGEPVEYMPPDETYSPMLHRINQVIKHRAVFPDVEPPPPYETLTKYSQPPGELVEKAQPALERVMQAAEVKKVPQKAKGRRYGRRGETEKPISGLDVGSLLAADPKRKTQRIDPRNAIPEFKQMVERAETIEVMHEACRQLGRIITEVIRESLGDAKYDQAVEYMQAMRRTMNDMDEGRPFNDFMRELKEDIKKESLGGDRREMWQKIRDKDVRLLTKKECEDCDVDENEARAFMKWAT